jgi:hypothetical protein
LSAAIQTAKFEQISPAHRELAINAIISLSRVLPDGQNGSTLVVGHNELLTGFEVFIGHSDALRGKTSRQLLNALVGLAHQLPDDQRASLYQELIQRCVNALMDRGDLVCVKPALQLVTTLIQKGTIFPEDVAIQFRAFSSTPYDSNSLPEAAHAFLRTVFRWVAYEHTAYAAARLALVFVKLLHKRPSPNFEDLQLPVWATPLIACITQYPEAIVSFRTQLLPELALLDIVAFYKFLQHLGLLRIVGAPVPSNDICNVEPTPGTASETCQQLLFASLQAGKENGLVVDRGPLKLPHLVILKPKLILADGTQIPFCDGRTIHISSSASEVLLTDSRPAFRLAGLSLLISSPSTTRPFSANCLRSLRTHMFHLFSEPDAHIRGEILSALQRLIDRLRSITFTFAKFLGELSRRHPLPDVAIHPYSNPKTVAVRIEYQRHRRFVDWLIRFLVGGMRPGAPYQRHFISLRVYSMLTKSGIDPSVDQPHLAKQALREVRWPLCRALFPASTRRLLLDLLMDPFDDIRSLAAQLLEICPRRKSQPLAISFGVELETAISLADELQTFLTRARIIMLSGRRADHADGVSRSHALLFSESVRVIISEHRESPSCAELDFQIVVNLVHEIQETINVARHNLSLAISKSPMHCTLASLRYVCFTAMLCVTGC